MAATPLPPSSRLLERHRFQVEVANPHPTRARSRLVYDTGRFATQAAAMAWADELHADADTATVTHYAASTGWRPFLVARRTPDAGWVDRFGNAIAAEDVA